MSPDNTSMLSNVDERVIPFPEPKYHWKVICPPLVYIFIPVHVSISPSHFIAPATFIAPDDHSESHVTSVLSVPAEFTSLNPLAFVFHRLTHEES